MAWRLANFFSEFLEAIPLPANPWLRWRFSSPLPGARYRVRRRTTVTALILPIGSGRRIEVSLSPTTALSIHAATRPDLPHVYAVVEDRDLVELMPAAERETVRDAGYLLEIPRRVLQSHLTRE